MKEYKEFDINGVEIKHGDKVVTIKKNGNAKGGDLVIVYVWKPNINTKARLITQELDLTLADPYSTYTLYTRLHNKILILKD